MRTHTAIAIASLLTALSATTQVAGSETSFQEIEESLTCQCGCGLTVHSCNHLQCPSALPLRAEIREQMQLGKDKAAILAHFEQKYGEKILSSPTTKGLNLLAWTMPFALIAAGGILVTLTVRQWSRRRATTEPASAALPAAQSSYSETLEKELRDFDA